MRYEKTVGGIFISRPNRFIAEVEVDGEVCVCHVKNTGRCRELLVKGARVVLAESDNPQRRTRYDLIAVYKGDVLVNMDSQAPNAAAAEWVADSGYFGSPTLIRPETAFGDSRIDLYVESGDRRIFIEVKGVTLEKDGVAAFPDAPTERGVKHLHELVRAVEKGFEAYALFVIQMKGCSLFVPNRETHAAFADALREAAEGGVRVLAMDCTVTEDSMQIDSPVKICLD